MTDEPPRHQKSGMLTTREAAQLLGVSTQTVRNRIRDGLITARKDRDIIDGRLRYYIKQEDIQMEMNDNGVHAAQVEDIVRRYTEEMSQNMKEMKGVIEINNAILEE